MSKTLTYLAFGLCLDSDLPLPFLPGRSAKANLVIRYNGRMEPLADPPSYTNVLWRQENTDWLYDYQEPDGLVLRFHFQQSGAYLSIHYSLGAMGDIAAMLMGPGLAAALHLRNVPLLHGASVCLDGKAVLVSGNQEMGKSTLTAGLVAAGLPLLTEDLTPLSFSEDDLRIIPGYPGLQLHAEAIQGLGYNLADCTKVYPGFPDDTKYWLQFDRLSGGFHPVPAPLGIIYLLSGRRSDLSRPKIMPLAPTEACLSLLEHIYGWRWLNISPQHMLTLCARIAERVQVRRVWTPEGLNTIGISAQALIEDAQTS